MMNRRERKQLKQARELCSGARKLLRIHRDELPPQALQEIPQAAAKLEEAVRARDPSAVAAVMAKLEKLLSRFFPRPKNAAVRENVEVLLVAIIVAMAVRTFFIQPFKIPTGSMQPTLYGIHEEQCDGTRALPMKIFDLLALGTTHHGLSCRVRGDHIFVDKISYHFRPPKRGEVVVFETTNIPDLPKASRGKFYIKRLIGLSNDIIRIDPPYVLVNGEILDERPAFQRIYSRQDGYSGYVLGSPLSNPPPKYLGRPDQEFAVPPDHFFVLGDNSRHSLDGRYWGAVPGDDLIGRAVLVYWPFSRRFGLIE